MLSIEEYNNCFNNKRNKLITKWLIVLFFIVIFLIISCSYKIDKKYTLKGIVKNRLIEVTIPVEYTKSIINKNKIMINNKEYKYYVVNIDSEVFLNNNIYYQKIILKTNNDFMDNMIVDLQLIIKQETIFKYIFYVIGGNSNGSY